MCGTSAQVTGQRRNRAGIREQGSRVPIQMEASHTGSPGDLLAGPTTPLVAEYQVPQLSAFAATSLQQSNWIGRHATGSAATPFVSRQQSGERGSNLNRTSQGRITELQLRCRLSKIFHSKVSKELAEIRAKTSELIEKRVTAEDQLKRIDIRAPQDGRVHQLAVHTVGGVINAGEAIMLIVPAGDVLTVEARIAPHEIDQIRVGQNAVLRFSTFNQRTTPELTGKVGRVSPDITQDQKSGMTFYTVRITLPDSEIARLSDNKLVPGMPVEAFIQTGERTALSYLVKPISDQLMRSWRER
jgi:HlyD family secretion protein